MHIETLVMQLKREHRSCGQVQDPREAAAAWRHDMQTRAISTAHAVLDSPDWKLFNQ